MAYRYYKQFRAVLLIELGLIGAGISFAYFFWDFFCPDTLTRCLGDSGLSYATFLVLSIARPFLLTPLTVFAVMGGSHYGPFVGGLFAAVGATLSTVLVYLLAKAIGKKLVHPWVSTNLPQTSAFLRSQDWKVMLACRLIPLLPFDLMTFLFGLANFRWRRLLAMTFLGVLPECIVIAQFASDEATAASSLVVTLSAVCLFMILPGAIIEFLARKRGGSMWARLRAMWKELLLELRLNNAIIKRRQHNPNKIPVLLLYGFFSSRRSLTVLEKILTFRGYEVFSFNLGGLFGVFFTKGIIETAQFIDYKLQRQFQRHKFDKIHIVAHSKGGLVALWWLMRLGGHRYCQKLVTMGTPWGGTRLTWLALTTPLGFIWKDMWQMRPGSDFLKALSEVDLAPEVTIYNMYSNKDKVTPGKVGIFRSKDQIPNVVSIPMHHISHFEYLYKRDVGDALAQILGSPYRERPSKPDPWAEEKEEEPEKKDPDRGDEGV